MHSTTQKQLEQISSIPRLSSGARPTGQTPHTLYLAVAGLVASTNFTTLS